MQQIFKKEFKKLKLFAFDPYDIALAKIERNIDRDREDVRFLVKTVLFDLEILPEMYFKELRPVLGISKREDLTLKL